MDTLPPTKPPSEFTGKGLEIIEIPCDFDFLPPGSTFLVFQDGRLVSPTKPPGEFTGHGQEIIGNPEDFLSDCVSLVFQDGNFFSLGLPARSLVLPADPSKPQARLASFRRYRGTRLAETVLKNPADSNSKKELKAVRKACREAMPKEDRATNNDVKKILSGDPSPNWSYQGKREKVAVSAIVALARELKRPPCEWELIDRMKAMTESINGSTVKILQGGDDKNLSDFLRDSGFEWLERWPRGHHRER